MNITHDIKSNSKNAQGNIAASVGGNEEHKQVNVRLGRVAERWNKRFRAANGDTSLTREAEGQEVESDKDETEAFKEYQPQQIPQELEQENIALRAENTLLRQEVASSRTRINEQHEQLAKIQNFIEKQHKEAVSLLESIQGEQTWRVVLPKVIDKLSEPFGGVDMSNEQIEAAPSPSETSSVSLEATSPKEAHKALTLPDPVNGKYERWLERDTSKGEKALAFMLRVWGRFIDNGVLDQIGLRGGKKQRGLDESLFKAVSAQISAEKKEAIKNGDDPNKINDLSFYLPTKSDRIDRELEVADFRQFYRLRSASERRKSSDKKSDSKSL